MNNRFKQISIQDRSVSDCDLTELESIGEFVCLPGNKLGFRTMYKAYGSECCIKSENTEQVFTVKCGCSCEHSCKCKCGLSFTDLYLITYNISDCDEITISKKTKLETFNYEGKIRRYRVCDNDMYFIELGDTHEVRILNPQKLYPIKKSDCCSSYADYEKIIIQGVSMDSVICNCEKRFLHIKSISYYGRRCT